MERYEKLFCELATGTIDAGFYAAMFADGRGLATKGEQAFYHAYTQLRDEYCDQEKHPEVVECLNEYRALQMTSRKTAGKHASKWRYRFELKD